MQVMDMRAGGIVSKFVVHRTGGCQNRLQHQPQRKQPQHKNAQERLPTMGAKMDHGRAGYRSDRGYTISRGESKLPSPAEVAMGMANTSGPYSENSRSKEHRGGQEE